MNRSASGTAALSPKVIADGSTRARRRSGLASIASVDTGLPSSVCTRSMLTAVRYGCATGGRRCKIGGQHCRRERIGRVGRRRSATWSEKSLHSAALGNHGVTHRPGSLLATATFLGLLLFEEVLAG